MKTTHITANSNSMFPVRVRVRNPEVIMPEDRRESSVSYTITTISGEFYRVTPKSPREIFAIQMLEHHRDKFAPAHGDGVILTSEALHKFN